MAPSASVLVKGGHLSHASTSTDVLCDSSGHVADLPMSRVTTSNTHGTGCTLASAIAAHLARGAEVTDAVRFAQRYVAMVLAQSASLRLGGGPQGAMDHSTQLCSQPCLLPRPPDLRLYAVTDPELNEKHGRSMRDAVAAAIAGGATMIQVRCDHSVCR
jgi:hydroxymethylpyrimidine kinase/phosphomethylpyrimidine kinase/thiamine-phosphate diphosphorylase